MTLLLIAGFVVLLDQLTKYLVRLTIPLGRSVPVIKGVFHLTYTRNPGAAFGLLSGQYSVFLVVTLLIIFLILLYYWRVRSRNGFVCWGLGLVLGGAVGNLIDRLSSGLVVDFLDFRIWPVFNLADTAIVIGVALLAWVFIGQVKSKEC